MAETNTKYKKLSYPNKMKKNRPIYFAMDHANSNDTKIKNLIVNTLKENGFNVVRAVIGPNTLYQNIVAANNTTNAVIFNLANGVDPSNIRECDGNDRYMAGRFSRGNDLVYAWFYDAADCVHENGRGTIKGIRGSESGGRMNNPRQFLINSHTYAICCSSDEHTKPEQADYTGEKVVKEFMALFEGYEGTSSTDTSGNTTTSADTIDATTETQKTLSKRVIEQTYTVPYYQRLYHVRTDDNGAFTLPLPNDMKWKGEYIANIHYNGDKTHGKATESIKIYNMNGEVFHEALLQTKTTDTYSDGTTSTPVTIGSIPNDVKTKTVITTYTYENGLLSNTTVKTRDDSAIVGIDNTTPNLSKVDGTNVTDEQKSSMPTSTNKSDPFFADIPITNDGRPYVAGMMHGGKTFEHIDYQQTYTLNPSQYRSVMQRDSKLMQLKDYYMCKFIAFESDKPTWTVVPRRIWNAIEQSLYFYLVKHNGTNWPQMIIDLPNQRTQLDGEWVKWQGNGTTNWFVSDRQNTGVTCGPTAASMCTQYLHNYISEAKMNRIVGAYTSAGSGDGDIIRGLRNYGFTATSFQGRNNAVAWVRQRKPLVFHIYNHYVAWLGLDKDESRILLGQSAGCSSTQYGPCPGWRRINRFSMYGSSVKVSLNHTISSQEQSELNHYWNSMGGRWDKPDDHEVIYTVGVNGYVNKSRAGVD